MLPARGLRGSRTRPGAYRPGLAALLGCLLALAPASAAEAAIGNPIDLGSAEADGTSATSLSVTTGAGTPAGASIIVAAVSHGPELPTSASCSDGAANAYATDVTQVDSAAITTICSTHQIAAALPSGSTITVSWSGGFDFWNQRIRALAVSGLAAAALDRTASASGTGLSPSSGAAAATSQPDELLVGAITNEADTASAALFSPGTNGTANNCAATGTPTYTALAGVGASNPSLFAIHCTVAATGTYIARGSFGASNPSWEALLATYRAEPIPNPPGPTPDSQTPSGGSQQAGEEPKCKRLRKKLKRQEAKLAKAESDAKRAQIAANIEDTKRRLKKLGCK